MVLLGSEEWKDKVLPIFIGIPEAMSIQAVLENVELERPLTHDLIVSILHTIGVKIERVTIDGIISGIYTSTIVLKDERTMKDRRWYVDSRPSDSIALALRFGSPIYVSRSLYKYTVPLDQFEQ